MNVVKARWFSLALSLAAIGGVLAPIGIRSASADDHDRNPRIHRAVDALKDAKEELRDAPHDFRGHKHDAMEAVQHAIDQLEIIQDWDH
jgi:hypothetical protein